jgi:membrane protein insertase Oxa1/YidC/SpoIIIJ
MMSFYQKEKINPAGGCLPMLAQFPVFIALFFALRETVELRHEPFVLWLGDLSAPDPFFCIAGCYGWNDVFNPEIKPATTQHGSYSGPGNEGYADNDFGFVYLVALWFGSLFCCKCGHFFGPTNIFI